MIVTDSIDYLASVLIPCRANGNSLVHFWGQNCTDAHHYWHQLSKSEPRYLPSPSAKVKNDWHLALLPLKFPHLATGADVMFPLRVVNKTARSFSTKPWTQTKTFTHPKCQYWGQDRWHFVSRKWELHAVLQRAGRSWTWWCKLICRYLGIFDINTWIIFSSYTA